MKRFSLAVALILVPLAAQADDGATQITINPATDRNPCWSPDGSQIAFESFRGGWDIWVIPAVGGNPHVPPTQITFEGGRYPSWSPDGSQIAFHSNRSGNSEIWVIPAAGGKATQITENPDSSASSPSWSPDGSQIAYLRHYSPWGGSNLGEFSTASLGLGDPAPTDICVIPVAGGTPTRLFVGDHLSSPSWSPDGNQIAFVYSEPPGPATMWVIPATGGERTQIACDNCVGSMHDLSWSPGSQIAFDPNQCGEPGGGCDNIWAIPATGGTATQITFNLAQDLNPSWSPDRSQIAFESIRSGNSDIWVVDVEPPVALDQESWGRIKGKYRE